MRLKYTIIPLISSLILVGCTPKRISSVSFQETSITLEEGNTYVLEASIEPRSANKDDLVWTTSDKFVATVDSSGLVTAVNEGYATITAQSKAKENVKATCEVLVTSKQEVPDSEVNFTKKTMRTYRYQKSVATNVDVYYRDDSLTRIPYISLKNYYNLLTNHEMSIVKTSDYTYRLTSANGETAVVNTSTDYFTCEDYQNFISTTIYRQDNIPNVYFDGAPFLRIKNVEHDHGPIAKAIEFKKYHINLFGQDDDILLPVPTASNMFMGPTMITCFCTADNMFFIDPNDPKWETGSLMQHNSYLTGISKFFKDDHRTKDEAKFAYGELCFLIDTYYGLPGREYLHKELKTSRDLDATLFKHNEMTKQARAYLLSTDCSEYLAGIFMLASFISDAGHTVADYGADTFLRSYDTSLYQKVEKKLSAVGFDASNYDAKSNTDYSYRSGLSNAYYRGPSVNNNSYVRSGDTLFYRFNQFDFNIYDWKNYYANSTFYDMPNDAVGNFKRMLDLYKDDSSIKNVVVDITVNPGGYGDVVAAFMGLMNQKTYQHSYDTIGERAVTVNYEFDKNFDGQFNEEDAAISYPFNFGVLCSGYSFSCGNLLPVQAKESGIVLLGDKSGGGSCAVIDATSAEGLYVRLSCPDHLIGLDGTEYEFGVPVDYSLVTSSSYSYNFSNLYNINLISEKMNEFYSR